MLTELVKLIRSIGLARQTVRRTSRGLDLAVIIAAGLFGLTPVAQTVAMAAVVSAAADLAARGPEAAGDRLPLAAAAFVAILVVQGVAVVLVSSTAQRVRRQIDGRLRSRVMEASLTPQMLVALDDASTRQLLGMARAAAPSAGMSPGTIAALLPSVLGYRIGIVARVAGLVYVWWPVGLAYAVMTVFSQAAMQQALWRLAGQGGGLPPAEVAYNLHLATAPEAAKELRVFGLGSWFGGRYRDGALGHIAKVWATRRDFTAPLIGTLAAMGALNAAAIVVLGYRALDGDLSAAALAFGVASIIALTPAGLNQDDLPFAFATATVDVIETAERSVRAIAPVSGHEPATDLPAVSIRLEDVHFTYPGAERPTLRGVDLDIRVGERTALVGLNGAGKTTLVKLLCRLHEPTSGRITVDGADLAALDLEGWRRQLAVMFQDYCRFEMTARDNVVLGAVQADDANALERAVAAAGADDFLAGLPAGWDSPLSAAYESGSDLSGGQWQRVALARTLYAVEAGARVLILDEPTSNLDIRAEAALFDSLSTFASGEEAPHLATLFISHRFSTVRQADRIAVLDDGRITERGTHEELVAAGGTYAQLFRAQAEPYAADHS